MKPLLLVLTWLFLLTLPGPGSVRAQDADLDAAFALLAEDSFAATTEAVGLIAASGHPRAAAILTALQEGRLFIHETDGAIVETERARNRGDTAITDAATGEDAGTVSSRDLEKIRINNRLRRTLEASLGSLELSASDPAKRLEAIEGLLREGSTASLDQLQAALEREEVEDVAEAMRFALAILTLDGDDQEAKLGAIETLSQSLDPRAREALLGAAASEDAALAEAATSAIEAIEARRLWLDFAVSIYQGISLGSILLLAAIGLAITFGVMGVINMAHGEMIMIGAYSAFVVQEIFRAYVPASMIDFYLLAALPAAVLIAGTVGFLIERGVIRHLYGRPLETLLATWGLSLILQQAVRSIFGPTNQEVANPAWMTGGFEIIGGVVLTYNRLIIIVFCLLVLAAVWAILNYSRFGLEMRAVTQNRRMAAAMGIDTGRVDAMTFALGSAVAGMGGVALSQVGNVSPNLGTQYIVDSFMVVVFGGVGHIAGTFVGAMSLGVLNKLLEPWAGAVLGKVIVLVLLILFIQKRPQGIFVMKGRAAEG